MVMLGCKNTLYNIGLNKLGVYDETLSLEKIESIKKEVVFFPMIHIGTEPFYKNISLKIDSLKMLGFVFYLENVEVDINSDSLLRKYKKISGIAFNQNGYTDNIDSLFKNKFKPKKKIISQPSYNTLGIDSTFGRVVDRTLKDLITYYEINNGEIILEDCDFQTSIFEKSICNDPKISQDITNDYRIDYRNKKVVQEILSDTSNKVAVIYGKKHIKGITDLLIENGYKKILNKK